LRAHVEKKLARLECILPASTMEKSRSSTKRARAAHRHAVQITVHSAAAQSCVAKSAPPTRRSRSIWHRM
jgi:hypothetical protein